MNVARSRMDPQKSSSTSAKPANPMALPVVITPAPNSNSPFLLSSGPVTGVLPGQPPANLTPAAPVPSPAPITDQSSTAKVLAHLKETGFGSYTTTDSQHGNLIMPQLPYLTPEQLKKAQQQQPMQTSTLDPRSA